MNVRILLNALDYGDAVSSCCIFIKKRCEEMGIGAQIYAEFFHPEVACHGVHHSRLLEESDQDDILLHQFFNESRHLVLAEQFPGRRVFIYQNITPPEWFPANSSFQHVSRRGIQQARSVRTLYEYAVGASEYTRQDLEKMGFPNTGVFPVLVDPEGLRATPSAPEVLAQRQPGITTFLFVGRVAPNKRIEDLLRFLAAYRALGHAGRLIVVGNDAQLPEYKESLLKLSLDLSLQPGEDFILTGKVPVEHLTSYYQIADAFLCMSEHEGFCVPLIESMAFHLPTFAYAATSCEQTLGGGQGLFYDKDFAKLAGWVADCLASPDRRAALLKAQQARLADFTPEAERGLVAQLLQRVQELPGRAQRRGNPRVSVIVNTYNRAEQLDRCLGSIGGQSFRDFEVVVVNGPSVDDTKDRLQRFRGKIKLVETDSRVLSVSRNLGVQAASGDLVAFIDDDAIAHPDWLKEAIPGFDDPETGAVGGLVYTVAGGRIEFNNGIFDRSVFVKTIQAEPGVCWDWSDGWLNTVRGCNCVFRRNALYKIAGFDEEIEYYHDEADVVMRLRLAGFKTIHRPRSIVYHESAQSHNRSSPYDLNWFVILKNGAYVPLKNYVGPENRWQVALQIARSLFKERFRHPWQWWRSGAITFSLFCRLEYRCARGMAAGIQKGLNPSPKHREIALPNRADFLPFNTEPANLLSVCLISQGLPPEQIGGVATYTMTLAEALRDLGCSVHLISKGRNSHSERRDGMWFHTVMPQPLGHAIGVGSDHEVTGNLLDHSAAVCAKVLEVAARFGVDIVEAPSWDSEGLVTMLDRRFPVVVRLVTSLRKVIETQHWAETPDLKLASDLEGEMLSHAAGLIFSTDSMRELVREHFGVEPARSARIPFGLKAPAVAAVSNSAGPRKILFVGRLETRKGIHVLLDAMPGVLRRSPGVVFQIVGKDVSAGDDSVANEWRRRYPEYWDRVQFCGEVTDGELSGYYETCDFLVAPSLYESFGLIYVEAMARGKAVVGTNTGGIPEVVQHGTNGLLVPPEDPDRLEAAITLLLHDEELRTRMAAAGYRSYVENFSAEVMAQRSLDFYREIIREWRARRGQPAWNGDFSLSLRGKDVRVEWDPSGRHFNLVADAGPERVLTYGPYISLDPGLYRAEFALWSSEPLAREDLACRIDVFAARVIAERRIFGRDLSGCAGSILDLFFSIEGRGESQVEFRVLTSGSVKLYLRNVFVARFQPN